MSRKLSAMTVTLGLAFALCGLHVARADTINGTPNDDRLLGTPGRDTVHGRAGDDDITGGRGRDQMFGETGSDTFHWRPGDGQDRIDGGADGDFLQIDVPGRLLRLHIDALDGGPIATPGTEREAIGVRRLEAITILGTAGGDLIELSSDRGVVPTLPFESPVSVATGNGSDLVDTRALLFPLSRSSTRTISTGARNDTILLGRLGNSVSSGPGNDSVLMGSGIDELYWELEFGPGDAGRDTVFGMGADDSLVLVEPHPFGRPTYLDTNQDGILSVDDTTVRVSGGSMTIDLTAGTLAEAQGRMAVTLIGRTRLPLDRILVLTD